MSAAPGEEKRGVVFPWRVPHPVGARVAAPGQPWFPIGGSVAMVAFPDKRIGLDALAARIPDGALVAIPAEYGGVAMAATLALVRRRVRRLRLVTVPTSGVQADVLIGAGAVAAIETAGVSLGEYGPAPHFRAAVSSGAVAIRDATCPALHAGIQAAGKGVPFFPLRGILGSDLLTHRPDWRVIQNPMSEDADPIVVVPAIHPDIALFHAALADRNGTVWVGTRRELVALGHAARRTLVTVEDFHDGDLLADPVLAAGTLPHPYVEAVALAPRGAWPVGFPGRYGGDAAALSRYAALDGDPVALAALIEAWTDARG